MRAPCFIYGLFNLSRTFAGGIRYIGVLYMDVGKLNDADASQLFYIDESGALCHGVSRLAVDIIGMRFSPMIAYLYLDPKHK